MILDQIREVPLTLTHRYSCPGILNSNRWLDRLLKAFFQKRKRNVMIPLLKKRIPFSGRGAHYATQTR